VARKPSDLGYEDGNFILPKLTETSHFVEARTLADGKLFATPAVGLAEEREEVRRTIDERCEKVAELVKGSDRALIWCNLNPEGDRLEKMIPNAVQVKGSQSDHQKEDKLLAFANGEIPYLVTKPKIGAFGLNLQNCAHVIFFPSHSYEQRYQGMRRCWRFRQAREVRIDTVFTEGQRSIMDNVQRKSEAADRMFTKIVSLANEQLNIGRMKVAGIEKRDDGEGYSLYRGDCVDVMKTLEPVSVHLSVYSPPFLGLYHYSSSERDLSNCESPEQFFEHYEFVVREIHRLTMPGRMTAVHCSDIPSGNTGVDKLRDFPGDIIRLHERLGWDYIARYSVWKEPLAVRNRTMAKNLAHKSVVDDSSRCSVASADYLLVFRRKGENRIPIVHPRGLLEYAGARKTPEELMRYKGWNGNQIENRYSHWIWRQYASAFWDDIRINRVLPFKQSKDENDEKHVHPLQLDVIDRCIQLWSNPKEVVLSPFAGVGSEVYSALCAGRSAIGVELKESYYNQMVKNVQTVKDRDRTEQHALFRGEQKDEKKNERWFQAEIMEIDGVALGGRFVEIEPQGKE
jgi:DNA modification methylase